ncbi:hypothetical protein WJX72_005005 [[Myrmecia] bisecta]|uniref:Uncharacterized protein n=1 Tax=[Myrmecia] bisecta TaxID=41462 RepID=A0AAW1Q0Y9_9CHLO
MAQHKTVPMNPYLFTVEGFKSHSALPSLLLMQPGGSSPGRGSVCSSLNDSSSCSSGPARQASSSDTSEVSSLPVAEGAPADTAVQDDLPESAGLLPQQSAERGNARSHAHKGTKVGRPQQFPRLRQQDHAWFLQNAGKALEGADLKRFESLSARFAAEQRAYLDQTWRQGVADAARYNVLPGHAATQLEGSNGGSQRAGAGRLAGRAAPPSYRVFVGGACESAGWAAEQLTHSEGHAQPLPCDARAADAAAVFDLHSAHSGSGALDTDQVSFIPPRWEPSTPGVAQVPYTFPFNPASNAAGITRAAQRLVAHPPKKRRVRKLLPSAWTQMGTAADWDEVHPSAPLEATFSPDKYASLLAADEL